MSDLYEVRFRDTDQDDAQEWVRAYDRAVTYNLLPVFKDLEKKAEEKNGEFDEFIRQRGIGEEDGPEFDMLMEMYDWHYGRMTLDFDSVPRQMIGVLISGVYHLWERLVKAHLVQELADQGAAQKYLKKIEKADFIALSENLSAWGWQQLHEQTPFFRALNRARLITNVMKHGGGNSAKELMKEAPELFGVHQGWSDPVDQPNEADQEVDAWDLLLAPEHFKQAISAVTEFFNAFPDKLKVSF